MDATATQAMVGIGASLLTQAVRRKGEQVSALEKILTAGGITFGATRAASFGGWDTGVLLPMIFAFAFHGLAGSLQPMQFLKFGMIDHLFSGLGRAFGSVSSLETNPPPASKPKP